MSQLDEERAEYTPRSARAELALLGGEIPLADELDHTDTAIPSSGAISSLVGAITSMLRVRARHA